jgi:hypothetical protein
MVILHITCGVSPLFFDMPPMWRNKEEASEASDGWRVVDDDDYNQSVGNPKRKV